MRNFLIRTAVALVGIPILLFAAIHGSWPLVGLAVILQAGCLWEWSKLCAQKRQNISLAGLVVSTAGLDGCFVVFLATGSIRTGAAIALSGIAFALLWETFRRYRQPLANLSGLILFLVYVALPLILWTVFPQADVTHRFQPLGPLALLLITTWICDTGAYLGGRALGRHKLYVAASPHKSVEGFLVGLILSFAVLPVFAAFGCVNPSLLDEVALPLIVGLIGQSGDLLESLIKREVQVKDTSAVIPGHGGFLDRFDSLLLSTPVFLAYLLVGSL